MAFPEPSSLTVEITSADIANSSQGIYANFMATALKRVRDTFNLQGIETQTQIDVDCPLIFADSQVYTSGSQIITLSGIYICTTIYGCDSATAAKIALQNIAGIKPTAGFTATLNKA